MKEQGDETLTNPKTWAGKSYRQTERIGHAGFNDRSWLFASIVIYLRAVRSFRKTLLDPVILVVFLNLPDQNKLRKIPSFTYGISTLLADTSCVDP